MNIKKNKGVTLIALTITVIVAIILAGITINSIRSEDSVISGSREYENSSINTQARVEREIDELYNELQNDT